MAGRQITTPTDVRPALTVIDHYVAGLTTAGLKVAA